MWMLFTFLGLIIVFIFWAHADHDQTEFPTQSESRPVIMNEIGPTNLPQRLTICYRITRWDLFVNHMTIWMRNRILQVIMILFLGWQLWVGLSRDFAYASLLQLAFRTWRF